MVLVPDDKHSAQSLDKMITLVAVLVEKSRIDRQLHLSVRDTQALIGGGKVRGADYSICWSLLMRKVTIDIVMMLPWPFKNNVLSFNMPLYLNPRQTCPQRKIAGMGFFADKIIIIVNAEIKVTPS